MPIAEAIALLEQLISSAIGYVPMVQGWIADRDYLKQLQDTKGVDYVPTAEDFAPYRARSSIAEAQIDANAANAG
jgi:hypothetical protein